jgi:hypothetical protein
VGKNNTFRISTNLDPSTKMSEEPSLRRGFTEIHFQELQRIFNQMQGEVPKLDSIDHRAITVIYDGFTVFSMFGGLRIFMDAARGLIRNIKESLGIEFDDKSDAIAQGYRQAVRTLLKMPVKISVTS